MKFRSVALTAVVLAVAIATAWIVMTTFEDGAAVSGSAKSGVEESGAGAGDTATSPPADTTPSVPSTEPPSTPDVAPVPVEREILEQLRSDQFLVEVVDAPSRAPVPGARVTWATMPEMIQLRVRQGGGDPHDDVELLDRFGAAGTTDGRGRLLIARTKAFVSFAAEHDGRWALRRDVSMQKESSVTLELTAEDCVRVKVVDREGRAVPGVAVAFGGEGLNLGNQARRAWTREPDGIALLRDLRNYVRSFSASDHAWCVMLLVPSFDAPTARIDPEHPPKEPVVLTLPDVGSMTFSFVGRDGLPVMAALDLSVIAFPRLIPSASGTTTRHSVMARMLRSSRGVLELPHVGPGLDFSITAKLDDVIVAQENLLPGPARAGEHVAVAVRVDVGPVRFAGRLVNEDGQALYDTDFTLSLQQVLVDNESRSPKKPLVATGRTDRDGRFEVQFDDFGTVGERELRLELHVTLDPATSFVVPRVLQRPDRATPIDLGSIKLTR